MAKQPKINQAGIQLENEVIGLIINESNLAEFARCHLTSEDFQQPLCKKLFSMAMETLGEGHSIDPTDMMGKTRPAEFKALASAMEAYNDIVTPRITGEKKIKDLQRFSDLLFGSDRMVALLDEIQEKKLIDPVELSNHLKSISETILTRHKRSTSIPMPTLIRMVMDSQKKVEDKIYMGLSPIDQATNGINRCELVTIAARTGVGKSALCMHPLIKTGVYDNQSVIYFSTEMDSTRLTRRMIANASGVSQSRIKQDEELSAQDIEKLSIVTPLIYESKIQFIDQVKYIDQIENAVRIEHDAGKDVRLIIVDYVQMLHIADYKKPRQQELSEISETLLRIGRKYNLTVLAVAQLNREVVKGKNGAINRYAEPDITQIKDCGSIEQDSDRIILLWQDSNDEHLTHFHLAKNREGTRAYFDMKFYGSVMRFYPIQY